MKYFFFVQSKIRKVASISTLYDKIHCKQENEYIIMRVATNIFSHKILSEVFVQLNSVFTYITKKVSKTYSIFYA